MYAIMFALKIRVREYVLELLGDFSPRFGGLTRKSAPSAQERERSPSGFHRGVAVVLNSRLAPAGRDPWGGVSIRAPSDFCPTYHGAERNVPFGHSPDRERRRRFRHPSKFPPSIRSIEH